MPIRLDMSPTYRWQVKVEFVGEDGETQSGAFTAIFKRMNQSAIDALALPDGGQTMKDSDFVREVLLGWDGISDSFGQPLPFSQENLAFVLDTHPYRQSIIRSWYESLTGAARKN